MNKIYFRIPFTLYFVVKYKGYIYLATKQFSSEKGYYWKLID